ncbi:DUF2779 domain-containing protein [Oceanispirochaeta sp. M2]|nr:DUF2779 domain-containing protein [Oceanispirochaeta sp. M2]NPD71659.1 DUF2779 domain-containing protein [Oceanispirochaeta sp. M1]RDG32856.1 DUF2779 domain-containing protein [Oceanispirochaeta sp. M1]
MMLSKSQYTCYLQCPKFFWLSRKKREVLTPPSTHQQQIFDTGHYVGETACRLFPGGEEIPFDRTDLPGMAARTKQLIHEGVTTIYEASFIFDEIFVAVDILHYENGLWNIYEVKSSTGVKDIYIHDAAVQSYVLENCGIKLKSENIVHINNRYVRGAELDLKELFTIADISLNILAHKRLIPERIKEMKSLLEESEPEQEIGHRCLSPYECFARDYCWQTLAGIPEDSVFTLTTSRMDDKFKYFTEGIIRLSDLNPAEMGKAQQLHIEGNLHIESDPIREFLSLLEYPISHLDFESFQQAVPEYEGVKPYQQIPFQYSLHIEDGNELIHKEFLGPWDSDPRRELAENLIKDIPEEGSILAYNKSFEKGVINKLAALFTDIEKELTSISERISDLMLPFQKRWYYHPEMKGSYSIKKVLPALVPEMEKAYADLPGVKNGGEASTIWLYLSSSTDPRDQEKIRQGLLEYCRLDTLAMVKILEILRTV